LHYVAWAEFVGLIAAFLIIFYVKLWKFVRHQIGEDGVGLDLTFSSDASSTTQPPRTNHVTRSLSHRFFREKIIARSRRGLGKRGRPGRGGLF
jgi:hypothetical protein